MFKTETHLHTSEVSPCGQVSAEEMVRRYFEAGYKTIFVSDHVYTKKFQTFGDIPWSEKIDLYLEGYKKAKAVGDELGMNIILSAEVNFNGCPNDYLLYGIDEDFLKGCPDLLDMGIERFYPYAKERGVTVVQAHPLRNGRCVPTPDFVDGLEVYNSNCRHENFTEKLLEIAKETDKPMTSGSDAHRIEDIALAGVITENEIKTAKDYTDALKGGKLTLLESK